MSPACAWEATLHAVLHNTWTLSALLCIGPQPEQLLLPFQLAPLVQARRLWRMTSKASNENSCLRLCSTADCLGSYASKGTSVGQLSCNTGDGSQYFFFLPTPDGGAFPPPSPPAPRPPLAPPPPQQGQNWTAVINNSPFQLVNVSWSECSWGRTASVYAACLAQSPLHACHAVSLLAACPAGMLVHARSSCPAPRIRDSSLHGVTRPADRRDIDAPPSLPCTPPMQDWSGASRNYWAGTWGCYFAQASGSVSINSTCSYLSPDSASLWTAVMRKSASTGDW